MGTEHEQCRLEVGTGEVAWKVLGRRQVWVKVKLLGRSHTLQPLLQSL